MSSSLIDLKFTQIYKLFRQQQNARSNWSKTIWLNLNPTTLSDGIANYLAEFEKFPAEVKSTKIGQMLASKMTDFRDSIPIMMRLKNDALRERHWDNLLAVTGHKFDLNLHGHFPLANIFQLHLNQHKVLA